MTCHAPSVIPALAGWRAVDLSMAELGRPEKPLKPKKPSVFNTFPMPEHKTPKKQLVLKGFWCSGSQKPLKSNEKSKVFANTIEKHMVFNVFRRPQRQKH